MRTALSSKTIACLALLLAASAGCPVQAQPVDCSLNDERINPDNGATTAGKSGLVRCTDRSSGEIRREYMLREGRNLGVQRWYERGKLVRERSVNERGNSEGLAREWNAQGVLVREGSYVNSRAVGVHRTFHDSGSLKSLSFHGEEANRNDALASMSFTRQGQIAELRCADRALLERDAAPCGHAGTTQTELFAENGSVTARVSYERGRLLREERFWDNGKPRSSMVQLSDQQTQQRDHHRDGGLAAERLYEGRQLLVDRRFGERDTLISEKRYAAGRLQSEAQWYLNGQRRRLSTQEDANTQLEQRFHDNGQLAFEGRFRNDARGNCCQAVALHRQFDEKGQLRRETHHDDKGRPNRERSWGDDGRLLSDDELFEDGSRKARAR